LIFVVFQFFSIFFSSFFYDTNLRFCKIAKFVGALGDHSFVYLLFFMLRFL
jgi:hypothetical protein